MLPKLLVNLEKLAHNATALSALCHRQGIALAAVTKCYLADEAIVGALLGTPIDMLGDSRLDNMARYPAAPDKKRLLLRPPLPGQAAQVVRGCDISMNSEMATLKALEAAAKANGTPHGVLLMVDVGDLREGIFYTDTAAIDTAAAFVAGSDWLDFTGMGLNLTCYGSIIPTPATMGLFAEAVQRVQQRFGLRFELVSGGNSSSVPMLQAGTLPGVVNHLRCGEAIICGIEAAYRQPIEGFYTGAIQLEAGLCEVQRKPSYPQGEIGVNAFGEKAHYEDKGNRRRGVLAVGRQDVDHAGLACTTPGVQVVGASSDHLIVDLEEAEESFAPGDSLRFTMSYGAILRAFTAGVPKEYLKGQ